MLEDPPSTIHHYNNVCAITKHPSAFCQVNYHWTTQLLLRYGEMNQENVPDDFKVEEGEYPDCFWIDKLTAIKIKQVTIFDESHKKQKVGKQKNGRKIQVCFRRDTDGNLDPDGQLAPKGYKVGMKYDKEARFCFGCTLDIDKDGIVKKNAKGLQQNCEL
jgi:hypothetical protein